MRSLVRLNLVLPSFACGATSKEIGIQDPLAQAVAESGRNGRILLVDDRRSSYERMAATLTSEHEVDVETDAHEALFHAADGNYDVLMVSLGLENFDALRLCSQTALWRTRSLPACPFRAEAMPSCCAASNLRERLPRAAV